MDLIFNRLPYDSIEEIGPAKIYFGAVGVCLIFFLISFFTFLSAVNLERETLMKKIVDTEYTLKKYFKVVASKHEVHKNLSLKTGELNMKKKQLPSEKALNKLLIKVTRLGKKRNVDIMHFKVAEGMADDFYKEIPTHFRFRGGLWETMDMFATIQNMLQIVNVKNMSFKVVKDGNKPQVLSSFIGSSYVYIDGL
ncbi:MAG: type 4a pilus biogenesis protein PilO [Nitrospina sp.]|nr:type 4a pilus biogenesis protein PilO [Nitrospina sp.]